MSENHPIFEQRCPGVWLEYMLVINVWGGTILSFTCMIHVAGKGVQIPLPFNYLDLATSINLAPGGVPLLSFPIRL